MEEFNQKQDPNTLYIAPNCDIELKCNINICNKGFGHVYEITNMCHFEHMCSPSVHRDECKQGWIAPLSSLTLNDEEKIKIGIPPTAKKFSYVFPPHKLSDHIDWNKVELPDLDESFRFQVKTPTDDYYREQADKTRSWAFPHFASFGAYAYFDENDKLLRINAITLEETHFKLYFAGPYEATPNTYNEVCDWNRYEPFYLDAFREIGFAGCSWIDANDHRYIDRTIPRQKNAVNDHGGFILFRHDKSALIFVLSGVNYTMIDRQVTVGGLFRDAIALFKENKESVVTTCLHNDVKPKRKLSINLDSNKIRAQLHDSETSMNDSFGWTKLHYACCFLPQDHDTISAIIAENPSLVTTKNKNDLYPLHIALQNKPSLEVVELLLKHDCQNHTLHAKSKHHGLLPIHFACGNKAVSAEVIQLLLDNDEHSTTLKEKSFLGYNCLYRAIAVNHNYDVIELIFNAYKRAGLKLALNVDGMSLIHVACIKGCPVEVVELLLDDFEFEGESFHETVSKDNSYGNDSELTGSNALHLALEYSTQEVVDEIIMKQVRLKCTFKEVMKDFCDCTLFHGSNSRGMLPIHIACKNNNFGFDTIQKLLRFHPQSVLEKDSYGNSPLHYACMNAKVDELVIQLLLDTEKEISKNTQVDRSATVLRNNKGETPLFLTIDSGAEGANALLKPEHICLRGLNNKKTKKGILAKDALIEWVVSESNGMTLKKCIVECLAERHYFALIMWDLIVHIVAIGVYFLASTRTLKENNSIHPTESITLISCIIVFGFNEFIQLNGSTISDYFLDMWNCMDVASIAVLFMVTYHMIELRETSEIQPINQLFIWAWILLLLQFVTVIRSTFFPFARFVAGVINIIFALCPFLMVSFISLLVFTYAFYMYGKDQCFSFGACLLWTLEGFIFGFEDFLTGSVTPFIDVLYGLLAVIVL